MTILTDTIGEYTSAAGVTVDGVGLKDGTVVTDTIVEQTSANGVDVDGVLLKDSSVTATGGIGAYTESAVATQPGMLTPPDETTINTGDAGTDGVIERLQSRVLQLEQNLTKLGLIGVRPATWTVTTTGAATHTITALTVSRQITVDWGDGSTSDYTGSGARTHNYAGAGTWTVTIADPLAVTALTLSDNKVTLNSADIAPMANMVTFNASVLKAGTFDSADVAAWRPTYFYMYSMPTGYAGTFDSADVAAWRPTTFYMSSMPTGYAGTFDSADVAAWSPETFVLYSMPVGTYTIVITANGFAAWSTGLSNFQMQGNSLTQAQVDAILWDLYQAAKVPRTATGGTINVGGTNAAPSGTFQAASACPVTSSTDGKEIAHELLNDTCAVGFHKWTTVTITA